MATDRVQIIFTTKGVTEANARIKRVGNSAKKSSSGVSLLTKALATIGAGLFVKTLIQTNIAFNKIETTLAALTGTTKAAKVEFGFLADEADRLGFVTTDLALNYARLSASTKGTILQGQATRDIFSAISEQARLLQLSTQDTGFAIRAITQIISKGVVTMEEMRRQLGDNLPGAFSKAAKSMDLTTSEFIELIESGNLLADEFIPRFAKFLSEDAAPGLDKVTTSLAANIERMKNSFQLFLKAIGDTGALESFNKGLGVTINILKLLTDFIEGGGVQRALKSLANQFRFQVTLLIDIKDSFVDLLNLINDNVPILAILAGVFNVISLAIDGALAQIQSMISALKILGAAAELAFDFATTGEGLETFNEVVDRESAKTEKTFKELEQRINNFFTGENQIVFTAPDTSALEKAFSGVVTTAKRTKKLVERVSADIFGDQIRQLNKQFVDIAGESTTQVVTRFQKEVNVLNGKFRGLRNLALSIGIDPKELEPLREQLGRAFDGLAQDMQKALEDTVEFKRIADKLKIDDALAKEAKKLVKELDALEKKASELIIAQGGDLAQVFIREGTSKKLEEFDKSLDKLAESKRFFSKEAVSAGRAAIREAGDLEIAESKVRDLEREFNNLTVSQQDTVNAFVDTGLAFEDTLGDMVTAAITGTGSVKEIFKGFVDQLISEIVRLGVIRPILDSIFNTSQGPAGSSGAGGIASFLSGIGTSLIGGASGLDFTVGGSGAVDSKFVPLAVTPGERIRVDTPTQQARQSLSTPPVIVQQEINIQTGVAQTVQAEIQNIRPQLAEDAKQAVVAAIGRGGTFREGFK